MAGKFLTQKDHTMAYHKSNMSHFEGNKVKDKESARMGKEGSKREVAADRKQMGPPAKAAPGKKKGC